MRRSPLAFILAALTLAAPAAAANNTLKDLMKTMGAAVANGDAKGLAPIFDKTIALAPKDPAFAEWTSIAQTGKAAADKGDLDGAKATCKSCHDKYRTDYKAKYGSKSP